MANEQRKRWLDKVQKFREGRKKIASKAKFKMYDELYDKVWKKESEKEIYRLAKIREKGSKGFQKVWCKKSNNKMVLTNDKDVIKRWKVYFEKLLNFIWRVSKRDSRGYFVELRSNRFNLCDGSMGGCESDEKKKSINEVPVEVWEMLGYVSIRWKILEDLFNKVGTGRRENADEWKKNVVLLIFKSKEDIQECRNYKGM